MTTRINRVAIERAYGLITPYIRVTPVVEASGADFGLAVFPLAVTVTRGAPPPAPPTSSGGGGVWIAIAAAGAVVVLGLGAVVLRRRTREG